MNDYVDNDDKEKQTEVIEALDSKIGLQSNEILETEQQIGTPNNNKQLVHNQSKIEKQKFYIMTLQELINLERKVRQHKRITIDITGCHYEIVKQIACEIFGWNIITQPTPETPIDWNLYWYDTYIAEEELRRMLPYQKINRFPGSFNLGRKNLLARNLIRMKRVHKDDYEYFPRTWQLPSQWEEVRQYAAKTNWSRTLIVKPDNSCQGRGIFLTKRVEGVIDFNEHFVVQEYINNPLLIDELKFDFRVYVLLKSVTPLKIFIYREGLARFATNKYEKAGKNNMQDMCMHLTNYAINKKNPNFIFNEKECQDNIGHKRSLTSVLKQLESMGKDVESIWTEISKILVKTIISVQPYLAHVYRSCQPKEENSEMAFEIYGFDIILDEQYKPWLLEVNHTPSFNIDTPLDYHIKKNLILDTIILENITWKARKQYYEGRALLNPSIKGNIPNKMTREEIDNLKAKITRWEQNHIGGFQKIFPSEDEKLNELYYNYMKTAQDQWDDWAGAKKIRIVKKDSNNTTNNNINTTTQNIQNGVGGQAKEISSNKVSRKQFKRDKQDIVSPIFGSKTAAIVQQQQQQKLQQLKNTQFDQSYNPQHQPSQHQQVGQQQQQSQIFHQQPHQHVHLMPHSQQVQYIHQQKKLRTIYSSSRESRAELKLYNEEREQTNEYMSNLPNSREDLTSQPPSMYHIAPKALPESIANNNLNSNINIVNATEDSCCNATTNNNINNSNLMQSNNTVNCSPTINNNLNNPNTSNIISKFLPSVKSSQQFPNSGQVSRERYLASLAARNIQKKPQLQILQDYSKFPPQFKLDEKVIDDTQYLQQFYQNTFAMKNQNQIYSTLSKQVKAKFLFATDNNNNNNSSNQYQQQQQLNQQQLPNGVGNSNNTNVYNNSNYCISGNSSNNNRISGMNCVSPQQMRPLAKVSIPIKSFNFSRAILIKKLQEQE